MHSPPNPFSPSFGISPPVLAGRREVFRQFETIFSNVRSPDYATMLWGRRGYGKTVLLNALQSRVRERGWVCLTAAAKPRVGLVEDLLAKAREILTVELEQVPRRRVSGVTVAGSGIETDADPQGPETPPPASHELETSLSQIADLLLPNESGLLITIDELHAADHDEIRVFGTSFQIVSRQKGRQIAFVGAALPEFEQELLAGSAATFLQRCQRHEIGSLSEAETEQAIGEPIRAAGARISDAALRLAVEASGGQPYLAQLIGYHAWDETLDLDAGVDVGQVERASRRAAEEYGHKVHGPVWFRLSDLDKRFLVAMLDDSASSAIADIGERWGHDRRSVGTYRGRLIVSGLIESVGRGRVAFADDAVRSLVSQRAADEGFLEPSGA